MFYQTHILRFLPLVFTKVFPLFFWHDLDDDICPCDWSLWHDNNYTEKRNWWYILKKKKKSNPFTLLKTVSDPTFSGSKTSFLYSGFSEQRMLLRIFEKPLKRKKIHNHLSPQPKDTFYQYLSKIRQLILYLCKGQNFNLLCKKKKIWSWKSRGNEVSCCV